MDEKEVEKPTKKPTTKADSDDKDEEEKEKPKTPSPDTKKTPKKKTNTARKRKADSDIQTRHSTKKTRSSKRSSAGQYLKPPFQACLHPIAQADTF